MERSRKMVRNRSSQGIAEKMNNPRKIAILEGGSSPEAEVSRSSASQVFEALDSLGYQAETFEIGHRELAQRILDFDPDVAFPALHGPTGEDGTIQGFLEILGIPYVGSGVRGSALAMDKHISKKIFSELDIPNAKAMLVKNLPDPIEPFIQEVAKSLGERVVVKPVNQGSALGVEILSDLDKLGGTLSKSLQYGDCLIEQFFAGKEITVGILEIGEDVKPHPVIEVVTPENQWYDFSNRYGENLSKHIVPALLPEKLSTHLQKLALSAHQALGLQDLSRSDFIVGEDEEIILLEVNTLPGMTKTSLYPDGARFLGYEFPALIELLIVQAYNRR